MCSRFVDEASVSAGEKRSDQKKFFYNTTFDDTAIPARTPSDDLGAPLSEGQRKQYLDIVESGLLAPARNQGRCGSCWAYAVTGAIQYSTALTYQRLGGFFNNDFMAPQLLLSCVEKPGTACGCFGGDLAKVMNFVSDQGIVTFRQFPYENDSSVETQEGQVHYVCRPNEEAESAYLGTCAPCKKGEVDYEQVVPVLKGIAQKTTQFATLSSCMPCGSVGPPFYFPKKCFKVFSAAQSIEENVEALKRLLVSKGPVCATLRVNQEDFAKAGKDTSLQDLPPSKAPVYAPKSTPSTGALHSVLVMGFYDPWVSDRTPEQRKKAYFLCRNSWGPTWGFRLRAKRYRLSARGVVELTDETLGGFFCVSMYEAYQQIGLLQTAVAIPQVLVKTLGDAQPRALRLTDPFVVRLQAAAGRAAAEKESARDLLLSETSPPLKKKRKLPVVLWLTLAVLLAILLLVIFAAFSP